MTIEESKKRSTGIFRESSWGQRIRPRGTRRARARREAPGRVEIRPGAKNLDYKSPAPDDYQVKSSPKIRLSHPGGPGNMGDPGSVVAMSNSGPRVAEFAEILRHHQTQLFGFIYSLVRDFDDADDLFQQTSLVLWTKFEQYDPNRSFIAWACGVARLECANFQRTRSRQRLYFGGDLGILLVEAQTELEHERLEERRAALACCMKRLRPPDRDLLQACYGGSVRIAEIARHRGRSAQSIHNALRRIRRRLYECIRRTIEGRGI
jgi:RNA polymerase sigma-70 factor (ECF subfamily)